MNNNPKKNSEGYSDPTTYHALRNIESEERFRKLLNVIFAICELSGFSIEGRISVRDKRTGKVWK